MKHFVYFDVEAIDTNAQVIFVFNVFFPGVEFFTLVNIFAARLAPEIKLERFKISVGG